MTSAENFLKLLLNSSRNNVCFEKFCLDSELESIRVSFCRSTSFVRVYVCMWSNNNLSTYYIFRADIAIGILVQNMAK